MVVYFPDLLEQYKQLLKQMRADGVTSGELYAEVKQAVQWMETGYDPAEFRAATRVDAFPMDPYHMQTYATYLNGYVSVPDHLMRLSEKEDTDELDEREFDKKLERSYERRQKLNSALRGLTDNERAVFIAIEGERMSFGKVAKMLGVAKGTVQDYHKNAKRKIQSNIETGIQYSLDLDDIA